MSDRIIADNRKARHDYFVEERFEAGLVLMGWEVKSLRDGRAQLKEAYVTLNSGEAWLIGAHFSPLPSTCTHHEADPTRSRKLLLHDKELKKIFAAVNKKGMTIVPLNLHWTRGRAKLEIAIARGKKQHDKRQTLKERDWKREKDRAMKR